VRSLRLPEKPAARSSPGAWIPWLLCVALAGAAGYFAYNTYFVEKPSQPDPKDSVESGTARQTNGGSSTTPAGKVALVAGGYVIPVRRVVVSPKVGGEVIELLHLNGREIREGDYVKKGQWLARLDRTKYDFELRRAEAMVEQARAEYDKLRAGNRPEEKKQAEMALREAEHSREQLSDELTRLRRSRSTSTPEEIYRVESRLSQAEAKVEQLRQANFLMQKGWREEEIEKAKQAYEHAKAQRDNAKYDLDNTEVVAPISGTILIKRAEVGNTVRPEAFSNGLSASLCEMADLSQLEVDVDISERDLNAVFEGQECEVRTEAPMLMDKPYKGKVVRRWPEANRSKASVPVRVSIEVPPDDRHLRPEMRARVTFLNKDKEKLAAR
jgi:multidrug resistance efflux pump